MTREEAVAALNALGTGEIKDPEADHGKAVVVLLELLESLGFGDVVQAHEAAIERSRYKRSRLRQA